MKKHRVLKTILLSIFLPIVLIVVGILTWLFFPIGINPSNIVCKIESDGESIKYNDKTYMILSDSKLSLPVQECGLIYKEDLPINEVYKSRFKHFTRPVNMKYFLIGDKVIIGHSTGAFYSTIFRYVDSDLRMPDLTAENIKKIEKCTGECDEYFETTIIGSESGNYTSASFNEHPPKDTSVYEHKLTVLDTISDADAIQPLIDLFKQKQEPQWSDEIKNGPERFLYKIEFVDEDFPFYLIVVR